MSFLNISRPMDKASGKPKKFIPAEVKCPNCSEPNLKLKFGGRSESGKIQFIDLYTNEIHVCNPKYVGANCKFCGTRNLIWVKSPDVRSGWEMKTKTGELHNCKNRNVSDLSSRWQWFFEEYVIWDSDSDEVKKQKMELQDRLKTRDPIVYDPKYQEILEDWSIHDFGNFKTCKCKQCDYRRDHPPERKFVVKKRA